MSKQSNSKITSAKDSSASTREEAIKIAHGIQKPGQTKEQAKAITQGIQKGIELYKKQHNAKTREIDKKRKQTLKQLPNEAKTPAPTLITKQTNQHRLPWTLLVLSWIGFGVYTILF